MNHGFVFEFILAGGPDAWPGLVNNTKTWIPLREAA